MSAFLRGRGQKSISALFRGGNQKMSKNGGELHDLARGCSLGPYRPHRTFASQIQGKGPFINYVSLFKGEGVKKVRQHFLGEGVKN